MIDCDTCIQQSRCVYEQMCHGTCPILSNAAVFKQRREQISINEQEKEQMKCKSCFYCVEKVYDEVDIKYL